MEGTNKATDSSNAQCAFATLCGMDFSSMGQKDLTKLVGVVTPRQSGADCSDSDYSDLLSSEDDDPMLEQMIFAFDLVHRVSSIGSNSEEAFECALCVGERHASVLAVLQHVLQTHCYCHQCSQGYPEVYAYQGHIWSQHAG